MATQTKRVTAADLTPPITVEQWGELEGPPHYDLIDGFLVERPDVAFWHEILLMNLAAFLHNFVTAQHLGIIVVSRAKLRVSAFSGREPDLFFIPTTLLHLIGRNLFRGIPELVVEILSPSNENLDRTTKSREYARLGIPQYWIVDFPNRRIEIYELRPLPQGGNEYELIERIEGEGVFRPALFACLEIPLAEVWPTEYEDRTDE